MSARTATQVTPQCSRAHSDIWRRGPTCKSGGVVSRSLGQQGRAREGQCADLRPRSGHGTARAVDSAPFTGANPSGPTTAGKPSAQNPRLFSRFFGGALNGASMSISNRASSG